MRSAVKLTVVVFNIDVGECKTFKSVADEHLVIWWFQSAYNPRNSSPPRSLVQCFSYTNATACVHPRHMERNTSGCDVGTSSRTVSDSGPRSWPRVAKARQGAAGHGRACEGVRRAQAMSMLRGPK